MVFQGQVSVENAREEKKSRKRKRKEKKRRIDR